MLVHTLDHAPDVEYIDVPLVRAPNGDVFFGSERVRSHEDCRREAAADGYHASELQELYLTSDGRIVDGLVAIGIAKRAGQLRITCTVRLTTDNIRWVV